MQLKRCASSIVMNTGVERYLNKIQRDKDLEQLDKFNIYAFIRVALFILNLSRTPFRYQLIFAVES